MGGGGDGDGVVVEGDVEGLVGEGGGVVEVEEEGLVPLGVEVAELGLGAVELAVEFDLGKGVGGAVAVLGHEVVGVVDLDGELHVVCFKIEGEGKAL